MDNKDFVKRIKEIQDGVNNRLNGLINLKFRDGIIIEDIDKRIDDCIKAIDALEKSINIVMQHNQQ